jgi:eukaryotic-like serine/threonine-protein kinase
MKPMDPGRRTLAGRYRLEQVIGRGGMSTVYRATDSVLARTVAVKILLAGLADEDPAYVARFQREARAAAALRDPAVVSVYDVGVDDGTRFIVMEHVDGRSLATLLKGGKPLPVDEALGIGEQVAKALGAAHRAGIVHRDIKPANVMVAGNGTVKVLDFGVARMLDGTTITQAASVLGTAAYMAPERALGEAGDARSDIYSLGCLLYAMLSGAPPFRAEHAAAMLHQHVNSRPPPVGELQAGVPPELDTLVADMLAKAPRDRPQSAERVGERLAAMAEPVDPTAPTAPIAVTAPTRVLRTPLTRSQRRRQALAAALATAAITLIVLLAAGGGSSSPKPRSGRTATHPRTTAPPATRSTPPPAATIPARSAAKQPSPAGPAAPAGGPPVHDGGPPPGHDHKHHGDKHGPGGG